MNTIKTEIASIDRAHDEWISNLFSYEEQLGIIDSITRQLQTSINDLSYQRDLQQLRNKIVMQKAIVSELTVEVTSFANQYADRVKSEPLTLSDLIAKNRMRDKLRKTEQSVFMLKYQVNKLLSIAS